MTLLVQTVNLDALAHNVRQVKALSGADRLMAVVKADGYAQGALSAARTALAAGATELGVATIEEALELRAGLGGAPRILAWIWSVAAEELLVEAVRADIELGIASLPQAEAVARVGQREQLRPRVSIMVDTGLGRSGLAWANGDFAAAVDPLAQLHRDGSLEVTGVCTHFACADEPGHPSIDAQAELFREAIAALAQVGLENLERHAANSPAALTRPDLTFDMVRPGLALYGAEPIAGRNHGLRPVLRWEAEVTVVKRLPAGQSVSYGHTWTTPRDTTIAIVPCGYADGLPRSASGKFDVSINGVRYPQVGRVCMDQFVVDLGPDSDVTPAMTAVIVGDPELGEPGIDELAAAAGTINYEILTAPKGRTVRRQVRRRTVATAEQMRDFGAELGRELSAGDLVIMDGPLGAGKTTMTQGIARGLQVRGRVTSPTFTIARIHPSTVGGAGLVHVDAYRLFGEGGPTADSNFTTADGYAAGSAFDALDALDLDTDLEDSVVVAEWGSGLAEQLAERYVRVTIDRSRSDDVRIVTISEEHR